MLKQIILFQSPFLGLSLLLCCIDRRGRWICIFFQSPFLGLSLLLIINGVIEFTTNYITFNPHSWVFLCFFSDFMFSARVWVPFNPHSWVFLCFGIKGNWDNWNGTYSFNPHSWVFLCFQLLNPNISEEELGLSIPILGSFFASKIARALLVSLWSTTFNPHSWVFLCFIHGIFIHINHNIIFLSIPILGSFFASQNNLQDFY